MSTGTPNPLKVPWGPIQAKTHLIALSPYMDFGAKPSLCSQSYYRYKNNIYLRFLEGDGHHDETYDAVTRQYLSAVGGGMKNLN